MSTENWLPKARVLTGKSLLLESIVYWGSFEMNSINLTRNNCRWCSMLFKTCYCLDLWKYDEINYAFSDVRLEQYYSNTAKGCQKCGCVCARTASRLTGFTDLANAELFLQDFLLLCCDWHCSTRDSYRWCFCTDKAQRPQADLLPKPLYMNNEKLNFRHPFPCRSVSFLSSHTLPKHSYQLSVWLVYTSAAGCSSVIANWKGIATSGGGTRVAAVGSKCVTVACGNEDNTSKEIDLTSEMKSFEKRLHVLLQHISGTLFYLSCLQKTQFYNITFWKKNQNKKPQSVCLRSRVHKGATNAKELRFQNKITEFWGPKLWGPLSLPWQWI